MDILSAAIAFAALKHAGQVDKAGAPYIFHPLRLMVGLESSGPELMAIAVLHDVVEDCDVSLDDLRALGMPERVVVGVDALSRRADESYNDFIGRAMLNRDALIVKRADLLDNMNLSRIRSARLERYKKALARIDAAIGECPL